MRYTNFCLTLMFHNTIFHNYYTASCSIQDGRLPGNEGKLHLPESPKHFYLDNQWVDEIKGLLKILHTVLCYSGAWFANHQLEVIHCACQSRLCVWTLLVPEGMHILLNFSHFDVEPDIFCDYDSLSVISKDDQLVGEFLFQSFEPWGGEVPGRVRSRKATAREKCECLAFSLPPPASSLLQIAS